jgi:hypothetical protein
MCFLQLPQKIGHGRSEIGLRWIYELHFKVKSI